MHSAFALKNVYVCRQDNFLPEKGLVLLLEDGRISRIAPEKHIDLSGLTVVDCKGAYVVPGLIDCHSHLSLDCSLQNYLQVMNNSEAELAVIAVKTMERDLVSGVTSLRTMGDRFFIDVMCKRMVSQGYIRGPELRVSGIGMRASNGHGFVGLPFDGKDALTGAIRKNLLKGVDWIKFYGTGTAMNDGEIQSFYSKEEIGCIINEAHRGGKPVTSHCIGGRAMLESIALGIDCIEHAYYAAEEEINAALRAGIPICLTPSEYFTDKPTAPAAVQTLFKKNRPVVKKSMEAIIQANIPFVLGTDGMHGLLWKEAEYAVSFGATPAQALAALTINAAKLLRLKHRGAIKEGFWGDFVLLRDNPLNDILNLSKVQAVYKEGICVYARE